MVNIGLKWFFMVYNGKIAQKLAIGQGKNQV
jgi:hypothetical protein